MTLEVWPGVQTPSPPWSISSQRFLFMSMFILVEDLRVTSDKDKKMPEYCTSYYVTRCEQILVPPF